MTSNSQLDAIGRRVVACERCPELRAYCAEVARTKKRAHRDAEYWGKPVPAFGDPNARVVLVGLAPGAHGSNRTGRMFTGDASGEWLYRALHRAGFANQPAQRDRDDGLQLTGVLISAAVRCAPPHNKPTPAQIGNCAPYLHEELATLDRLQVVVGLGAIGMRAAELALRVLEFSFAERPRFGHGAECAATRERDERAIVLVGTYHPSRQNTNTGVLTEPMFDAIFGRVRDLVADEGPISSGCEAVGSF